MPTNELHGDTPSHVPALTLERGIMAGEPMSRRDITKKPQDRLPKLNLEPKDYSIAERIDALSASGELKRYVGKEIDLLGQLLIEEGIPGEATLAVYRRARGSSPEKLKKTAVSLIAQVDERVIRNFDTHIDVLQYFAADPIVNQLQAAFNAGSPYRQAMIGREVMQEAQQKTADHLRGLSHQLFERLIEEGTEPDEAERLIRTKYSATSGKISDKLQSIRDLDEDLRQKYPAKTLPFDIEKATKQFHEAMEAQPEEPNQLYRSVVEDLHLLVALSERDIDEPMKRIFRDGSKFNQLNETRQQVVSKSLFSKVDELAVKKFNNILLASNILTGEVDRGIELGRRFRRSVKDYEKIQIARDIALETLTTMGRVHKEQMKDLETLLLDQGIDNSGVSIIISPYKLGAGENIVEMAFKTVRLRDRTTEARLETFVDYAQLWDRLNGGNGEISEGMGQAFNESDLDTRISMADSLCQNLDKLLGQRKKQIKPYLPVLLDVTQGSEFESETDKTIDELFRTGPRTKRIRFMEFSASKIPALAKLF